MQMLTNAEEERTQNENDMKIEKTMDRNQQILVYQIESYVEMRTVLSYSRLKVIVNRLIAYVTPRLCIERPIE